MGVTSAQPFFITVPAVWALSYDSTEYETNDNTNTTMSFMYGQLKVDSGGHYLPINPLPLVQSTPVCPNLNGYWGDYDDVRVLQVTNNLPIFIRAHTDSTDQCAQRWQWNSTPLHVSAHTFAFP